MFRKAQCQVLLTIGLLVYATSSCSVELTYKVSIYGRHIGYIKEKKEAGQTTYSFRPALGVDKTLPSRLYLMNERTGLPAYQSEPEACDTEVAALERAMTQLHFELQGALHLQRFKQEAAAVGLPRAPSILPPLKMAPFPDEIGKYVSLFQLNLQATIQVGQDGIITTQTHEHNPNSGSGLATNTEGNTELSSLLLQGTQAFHSWLNRAAEQAKVALFAAGIGAASISSVRSVPRPSGNGANHAIIIAIERHSFTLFVAVAHGLIQRISMTDRSGNYAVDIQLLSRRDKRQTESQSA